MVKAAAAAALLVSMNLRRERASDFCWLATLALGKGVTMGFLFIGLNAALMKSFSRRVSRFGEVERALPHSSPLPQASGRGRRVWQHKPNYRSVNSGRSRR